VSTPSAETVVKLATPHDVECAGGPARLTGRALGFVTVIRGVKDP
jgi:hypothetical protein